MVNNISLAFLSLSLAVTPSIFFFFSASVVKRSRYSFFDTSIHTVNTIHIGGHPLLFKPVPRTTKPSFLNILSCYPDSSTGGFDMPLHIL